MKAPQASVGLSPKARSSQVGVVLTWFAELLSNTTGLQSA